MKKLNQIFYDWKPNTIFTSRYFEKNNISPQLLNKYLHSEWLERLGNGAYTKKGDLVDWLGGLQAIQKQLKLQIHIGGKTALTFYGLSHYINQSTPFVELYALNKARLPKWFLNHNWDNKIIYSTSNLFGNKTLGITEKKIESSTVLISTPERAIMELLNNLPAKVSFDEVYKIMEGLYNLRPELINELLENCTSIKVKRLFFFLSERVGHLWLEDLTTDKINFGHGKREIIREGVLNKKYMITVPEYLEDEF